MPEPQSPTSLLADAVQRLHERSDLPGAACAPGPVRPDDRFPMMGSSPSAYVLGRRWARWTVDDVLPVRGLLGWRAPRSSWAVVVVAPGRAGPLDAGPGTDPTPVGLALGVARGGETIGRLSAAGGTHDHTPESGRLLDTLQRNLGLPTPPPPEDTGRFLALAWLADIAATDGGRDGAAGPGSSGPGPTPPGPGRAMGWPAVVRLHPASRLLIARGERLRTVDLEGVLAVARSTWTWEVLHRAEIGNPSMAPLCPPGTAPWMDTGMYARWVLAELPATESLWRRAQTRLTPAARRRLQRWLRQSDIAVDICAEPKRC